MSVTKRSVYHTQLKYLAYDKLLSHSIAQQIPRSTLARWKNEDPRRYQSFDLNLKAAADYELIQDFARNQAAKRIYAAHVRVIKTVISIAHGCRDFHRKIKDQRKNVVELINRVKNSIGLKHALRFFNISIHTFRNWSQQSNTACFESLTNNCNKVYPGQLSKSEVMKLKEYLSDDQQFQYWPISSIALHTLRNNILPISLNTWYKYANKLGLARPKPFSRRKKNNVSIRAKNSHAIWHADITRFVTTDNVKHYIYVVVDNYSRKILSWSIADAVKSEYRKLTIEQAIENVKTSNSEITLITDGGPENKLQSFLNSLQPPIDHKIALVDVHYSNSLIEAAFKTLKYNYLYRMSIRDGKNLHNAFSFAVEDFNNRPHISLNGLTPNEAEQNLSLDAEQLRSFKRNATEVRKKHNQIHQCNDCKE